MRVSERFRVQLRAAAVTDAHDAYSASVVIDNRRAGHPTMYALRSITDHERTTMDADAADLARKPFVIERQQPCLAPLFVRRLGREG